MASSPGVTQSIRLDSIGTLPKLAGTIAMVGPPNAGKSTLFNQLTGLRQKTANYPGVTVEKKIGRLRAGKVLLDALDLPGIYSLSPASLDEKIAVDVLLGERLDSDFDGICAVIDATRLQQGLYLLRQLLDLQCPLVVALTMTDAAARQGQKIDVNKLSEQLGGVPVIPVVATTGQNLEALRQALGSMLEAPQISREHSWSTLDTACKNLQPHFPEWPQHRLERLLVDGHAVAETSMNDEARHSLQQHREQLFGDHPPVAVEARYGHQWVKQQRDSLQADTGISLHRSVLQPVLDFLQLPVPAMLLFFAVMFMIFQAVFYWATPMMDGIDASFSWLSVSVSSLLPDGMLNSLLVDGVIAGVGSVLIFLPQIMILFLFIIVMEDSGYLARSAFLMDRAMRSLGMSGQSVIPMVASFACAVPAIMSTRVIATPRERLATILATPFITCSARLPVYALLIGAFVPASSVGGFNLQGLVLFGLYLLGIAGAAITALIVTRLLHRGAASSFVMSLPEFRIPNVRTVLIQLLGRVRVFLRRAGRVIFLVTVIVWALAYFPRSGPTLPEAEIATLDAAQIENVQAASQLENSLLGSIGKTVAPVFRPLGWDWKVSAAVIAGFPAREIMVAVLGTIYAVGDEADEQTLAERLNSASRADGSPVFTLPMVLGLLVFYALCLQCAATIAVMRRETNTWRWPIFAWLYMTSLGYLGALLIYQGFG